MGSRTIVTPGIIHDAATSIPGSCGTRRLNWIFATSTGWRGQPSSFYIQFHVRFMNLEHSRYRLCTNRSSSSVTLEMQLLWHNVLVMSVVCLYNLLFRLQAWSQVFRVPYKYCRFCQMSCGSIYCALYGIFVSQ